MCGIVGFSGGPQADLQGNRPTDIINKMSERLWHRGPDAGGAWVDGEKMVALGHRRLAIVDLSAAGSQPMTSKCGRYVIVYNGEIYNAGDIAQELSRLGKTFSGHSDTEVLIEAIASWGLEQTLKQLIGMFAFALFDKEANLVWLVRDRLGIKPLYYGRLGDTMVFASELGAIKAFPFSGLSIDRNAIASYLRHNYIPAPGSVYAGISKLAPGSMVAVRGGQVVKTRQWWSLKEVALEGKKNPFTGTSDNAIAQLDDLLSDAVGRRMIADVPLGAFLSGGIDSSLVVSLMQKQSAARINTFSIGFEEAAYDESRYARQIAQMLETNHTEYIFSPTQVQAMVPGLSAGLDEPFGDSSYLPTLMVSQLAKRSVTVSLSGDGGDELFLGYQRYFQTLKMARLVGIMPRPMQSVAGSVLGRLSVDHSGLGQSRAKKMALILQNGPMQFFQYTLSHFHDPAAILADGDEFADMQAEIARTTFLDTFIDRMRYQDASHYLPDDILTKVDRASMQVALEARVPILDHRVVEFAWTLPHDMLKKEKQGKWILREILKKYLPETAFDRPKTGFGIPLGNWLRGPLREWAEELLSRQACLRHNLLDAEKVEQLWQIHLSGADQWQYHLWDILQLHSWLDHHKAG